MEGCVSKCFWNSPSLSQGPFLLLTQREQQLISPHLPNPKQGSGPRTRSQLMASEWPASHSGYPCGDNLNSGLPKGEAESITTNW